MLYFALFSLCAFMMLFKQSKREIKGIYLNDRFSVLKVGRLLKITYNHEKEKSYGMTIVKVGIFFEQLKRLPKNRLSTFLLTYYYTILLFDKNKDTQY